MVNGDEGEVDTASTNLSADVSISCVDGDRPRCQKDVGNRADEYPSGIEVDPVYRDISDAVIADTGHNIPIDEGDIDPNDEVGVAVNSVGELVARLNQVEDYQARGSLLEDVCVWDFVAQVDKIRKSKRKAVIGTGSESKSESSDDFLDTVDGSVGVTAEKYTLFTGAGQRRPTAELIPPHAECLLHIL